MRISDWSSDVCSSDLNNVLATVARADGEPLNGTDIPGIFEGSFDGNGRAITNSTDKWYPRGTVRAGVIWRSGPPPAYDQTFINTHLPRYDVTIGYASHTHYSNNGFDGSLWGGESSNGFGHTRVDRKGVGSGKSGAVR